MTLVLKLQSGSMLQPLMQQDNTKYVKPLPPQLKQKNIYGQYVDPPSYQGTITTPRDKSLPEKFAGLLNKVDRNGDNMVAGIVTQPLKAATRILEPGKYFNNINNDDDVKSAFTNLGMDALTAIPAFKSLGTLGKIAGNIGEDVAPIRQLSNASKTMVIDGQEYEYDTQHNIQTARQSNLDDAHDWIDKWRQNPIIQNRITQNNRELLTKYKAYVNPNAAYADIIKAEPIAPLKAQLTSHLGSSAQGIYYNLDYPDNDGEGGWYNEPNNFAGKAYVNQTTTPIDKIKSTAIHEMTHQMTDANNGLSFTNKRLLTSPFGGINGRANLIENADDLSKGDVEYLTDPTEVHARINELRAHYGITPNLQLNPSDGIQITNDIKNGTTPVNPKFGELIQDPSAFTNVFNKMFLPAAATTVAVTALKQSKGGVISLLSKNIK